ncbi:MAG TPA: SAM-dependent methyltransferase, partial [Cellvibrio sp.]|nr:SAM-dependent methyltransferase [Cellvibrio sp.]
MMELKSVVPWGRSLDEYRNIFMLSESDLNQSILGCGDGPASFNAEATALGKSVISVDPVYKFTTQELQNRINEVYQEISVQLEINKENYIWETFKSVEEVFKARMSAMNIFLKDYESGKLSGRYVETALPILPFRNQQFSI